MSDFLFHLGGLEHTYDTQRLADFSMQVSLVKAIECEQ